MLIKLEAHANFANDNIHKAWPLQGTFLWFDMGPEQYTPTIHANANFVSKGLHDAYAYEVVTFSKWNEVSHRHTHSRREHV